MALIELRFSSHALAQAMKDSRRDQLLAKVEARSHPPVSDPNDASEVAAARALMHQQLVTAFDNVVRFVEDHPSTCLCDPLGRQLFYNDELERLESFYDGQQETLAWVCPPGTDVPRPYDPGTPRPLPEPTPPPTTRVSG